MNNSRLVAAWDRFWRETSAEQGDAIWDSEPAVTAALHVPIFDPYIDSSLPLLDLGCGNGTQTRYLASRYERVVGIDLSAAAIDLAKGADPQGRVDYRHLSVLDPGVPEALRAELGDVNVYMRGIIHQSDPPDRPVVARAVATLLGERGRVFCLELAMAAAPLLRAIAADPSGPPEKVDRMLRNGVTPAQVSDEELAEVLRGAGLAIVYQGTLPLHTTLPDPATGLVYQFPMLYFIAARRFADAGSGRS